MRKASLTDLIMLITRGSPVCGDAYESRTAPVEVATCCSPGCGRCRSGPIHQQARKHWRAAFLTMIFARPRARRADQQRAQMHLDTVCTMVDTDTTVMYANVVDTLEAFTIQHPTA